MNKTNMKPKGPNNDNNCDDDVDVDKMLENIRCYFTITTHVVALTKPKCSLMMIPMDANG